MRLPSRREISLSSGITVVAPANQPLSLSLSLALSLSFSLSLSSPSPLPINRSLSLSLSLSLALSLIIVAPAPSRISARSLCGAAPPRSPSRRYQCTGNHHFESAARHLYTFIETPYETTDRHRGVRPPSLGPSERTQAFRAPRDQH